MAARNINVNLWANTSGFVKGFNNAQKTFSGFVSVFQAGIAALGLSKLAAEFHEVAMGVDDVADNAAKLGITAQSFEALSFAAERFNVSQQAVTSSVQKMLVNVGKGAEVFSKLGLSIDEIKELSPDEMFVRTAAAIAKITDATKQAAAAQEAFGRGGKELLGVIRSGELEETIKRGIELNNALTENAVKNADRYANAVQEMGEAWKNYKRQVVGNVLEAGGAVAASFGFGQDNDPMAQAIFAGQAANDRVRSIQRSMERWGHTAESLQPDSLLLKELNQAIAEREKASRRIDELLQKESAAKWQEQFEKDLFNSQNRNRVEKFFMAPVDALNQLPEILRDAGRQLDVLVSKAKRFAEIAGFKTKQDREKMRSAMKDQADALRQQIAEAEAARIFDTADAIAGIGSPSAMTRGSGGDANFFANLQAEMRGRKASENYLKENNMTAKRQLTELERMRQRLDDIDKRIAMIPTENYN